MNYSNTFCRRHEFWTQNKPWLIRQSCNLKVFLCATVFSLFLQVNGIFSFRVCWTLSSCLSKSISNVRAVVKCCHGTDGQKTNLSCETTGRISEGWLKCCTSQIHWITGFIQLGDWQADKLRVSAAAEECRQLVFLKTCNSRLNHGLNINRTASRFLTGAPPGCSKRQHTAASEQKTLQ